MKLRAFSIFLMLIIVATQLLAEPAFESKDDLINGKQYGIEHELDRPFVRTQTAQMALAGQLDPDIVATFESATTWIEGVNWGGETFGGSIGKGIDFLTSNLGNSDYVPIEIRFSTTDSTLCQTFRRDLGWGSNGVGTFPGTAWDMTDTLSPRRVNMLFVEDAAQQLVDHIWNPNTSGFGGREYLFIMLSDYDGTGTTYAGANVASSSIDVLYSWWPQVSAGSLLLETLPATLDIGVYRVKNFRGLPDSTQITLTWNWFEPAADQFDIYSGTDPNTLTLLTTVTGSERSHDHTDLTTGLTYYYRVEAVTGGNKVGESPQRAILAESVSQKMILSSVWNERGRYGDIWGYVDPADNKEYALLCARNEGVSVIDITVDPPVEVAFIASLSPDRDAKDVKIYQNYAIIIKENEPLQIIDMTNPASPVQVSTWTPGGGGAHNCIVDGDYLYVSGNHAGIGGLEIVDISNPSAPFQVGQFQPYYYHDIDIRNDTIAGTGIYGDGIDLIDVSNKAAPSLIVNFNYAGSGSHNAEYSTDGNFLFTGDEIGTAGNHTRVWDISNVGSVSMVSEIIVDPLAVVHNSYVLHDTLLVLAHYTEGIRVWNIATPALPFEIAYYDTFLPAEFGYQGCWSVFVDFPSGKIVASDMQTGLYVLELDFPAPPSCCIGERGNVDDLIGPGGPIDVSDLTYLVAFLFKSGPVPPCTDEGNVDGIVGPGGPIDVSDLTYLVAFLFKGGPLPAICP